VTDDSLTPEDLPVSSWPAADGHGDAGDGPAPGPPGDLNVAVCGALRISWLQQVDAET
jgi:hypothetical protein